MRQVIQRGLAIRNAHVGQEQIQMLINKNTGEKWIKIRNVERTKRTTVQLAIMQAGIRAITPSRIDLRRTDWAILFRRERG